MPNTLPVVQLDNELPTITLDGQLPTILLDGQLPVIKLDKQITAGTAAERGYLSSAMALSKALGELFGVGHPNAEVVSEAQRQAELASAQHPIATGVGELTPKILAGLPAIPAGFTLGAVLPQAVAGLTAGGIAGAPAASIDYETTRARILRETGDKDLADKMASTARNTTLVGSILPGGVGTRLLPKVATGIGLNVGLGEAEVAIQNKTAEAAGQDKLKQELWDPTRMGLNAAFGAFSGAVGSTPARAYTPEGIMEELRNAKQAKAQAMGKPMTAEETRLFHVENRSLEETNKLDYYERAKMRAEEALNRAKSSEDVAAIADAQEKLTLAQRNVDETLAVIKSSEKDYKTLSGTAYKTPEQRFDSYLKEATDAGSTALLRRAEAFGNYHLRQDPAVGAVVSEAKADLKSRAGKSGRLGPDERRSNAILDNINFNSVDDAHASIRSLIADGTMSLDEVDKLIARNTSLLEKVAGLDTAGKLSRALIKEQEMLRAAKRDIESGKKAPAITNSSWQTHRPLSNLTVHNATKAEADLVASIVRTLGLSGETITLNLRGPSSSMNSRLVGSISENQAGLLNSQNITWFQRLNRADIERFHRAWHIAHELGHALTIRLLRNDIFKEDLAKLNDAYLKYLENNPIAAKEGAMGNALFQQRVAEVGAEEYMTRFAEYFAQRVAREMTRPTDGAIGSFVKNIGRIWKEISRDLPLGSKHDNLVDTFIQDLIQKNRTSIENTGKTIFEVTSTERSLAEAFSLLREMSPVPPDYRPRAAQSPFDSAGQAISALGGKDIDPVAGEIGTVFAQVQSLVPLLSKKNLYNNPVVSYLVTKIWNAFQSKTRMEARILGGDYTPGARRSLFTSTARKFADDSFHTLAEQASARDFYEVGLVFQRGSGRLDYESNLYKNGIHLTDRQKALYRSIAKVYGDVHLEQNAHQKAFGRAMIPQKLGYVPPIRKGNFAVTITDSTPITRGFAFDEAGNRVLDTTGTTHVERFHTKQERDAWITRWKKLNLPGKVSVVDNVPEVGIEHLEMVQAMRDMAVLSNMPAKDIARMDALLGEMVSSTGKVGGHHKRQMGFIGGGMGTGMFRDQHQLGQDFKVSVVEYVSQISSIIEKQTVDLHAKSLLLQLNPETHGNLIKVIEGMREHAVGGQQNFFGKGVKELVDSIMTSLINAPLKKFGKEWYPQQHVWDTVMGKITHAFYIKHLMSSVVFAASQSITFGVSMRSLVRDQGILDAVFDMSNGFNRLLKNDPEFFKFVEYAVSETGSYHPSFLQDLTKHGFFENIDKRNKVLFSILSGEFLSTKADSFSRLMTSAFAFAHFSKKGYHGKDLYDQVLRLTDDNMILYNETFKAPIYRKMGIIGEAVSPLATFPTAQIANLAADVRFMGRNRKSLGLYQSALPFLTTLGMAAVLSGMRGVPLVLEAELILQAINWGLRANDDEDPYQLPTIWDWYMGSPTDNKAVNTAISHGTVAAATLAFSDEGLDLGASSAWRAIVADLITGDKTMASLMPTFSWAGDVISDMATMAGTEYPTTGQKRELLQKTLPKWLFGAVDAAFFGAFEGGTQQVASGDSKLKSKPERAIAHILGGRTVAEQKELARQFKYKQLTMKERREANDIIRQISSGNMPEEEMVKQLRILVTRYHMPVDDITSSLKRKAINSNISTEEMPMGREGMPTLREWDIYQRSKGKN